MMLRTRPLLSLFILTLFLSCTQEEPAGNYPIMGNLALGKHPVGYKTLFVYDQSQVGIPYSDWKGKLYPNHNPSLGRQHQINIWYPAQAGTGTRIKYEHYVHLAGRHTSFEETDSSKRFGEQLFTNWTNDLGANGAFGKEQVEMLMELEVSSRLDARPTEGNFPVIVIPNESHPVQHSITAEFLASQGYVVVGFAPKGRFSSGLEISAIGLEKGVDDLEFVLGEVSKLPFANMDQVALAANAIYSSICAAAVARNQKLRALISLEGGLPSEFEQRLLRESVFYEAERIRTPMLIMYSPHPAIDPEYISHLTYAKRYFARFPTMSEFVALNYGMFDSMIPNIIGKHEGGAQVGYETMNRLMLRFLNKHLKMSVTDVFANDFMESTQNTIDTTFIQDAFVAPPNIAEMKQLFLDGGFELVDSIYQNLKADGNPQPFSSTFYHNYRDWLAWQRDPDYVHRKALYTLGLESYPASAVINFYFAYYAEKTGDTSAAIQYFQEALNLMGEDETVSASERRRLGQYAENALDELR